MKYQVTRTMTDVIEFEAANDAEAVRESSAALNEVRMYGVMGCRWIEGPEVKISEVRRMEKT